MGFKVTEEQLAAMEARVAGKKATPEPVRATLPAQFTIIGHAVSQNGTWKPIVLPSGKASMVKTAEGRTWCRMMEDQLRQQWGPRAPWDEEAFLIIDVYLSANTMDEDNPLKPAQDALQAAGVITNDRLVRRATITKHVDRHRPRVELVLYPSTLKPL